MTSLHFRIVYNWVLKLLVYACKTNEIENRKKVGKGGIKKLIPTNYFLNYRYNLGFANF